MVEEITGPEREHCEKRKTAYDSYVASGGILSTATQQFMKVWNAAHPKKGQVKESAARKLIRRAVHRMDTWFSLRTRVPSGPRPDVPDAVIKQCGTIIGAGHIQECCLIKDGILLKWGEPRYFTSLHEAVSTSPQLSSIMKQHDMKIKYLRRKLSQLVPDLKYHVPYMRQPLRKAILEPRMQYGYRMYKFTQPSWESLLDVHWMDECTIYVGRDLIGHKLHVWSFRGCTEGLGPEPNPWFLKHTDFKISLLLVVNGRTGFTYVEVLTGTTGKPVGWRFNPEMQATMTARQQLLGDCRYKVSQQNNIQLDGASTQHFAPGSTHCSQST